MDKTFGFIVLNVKYDGLNHFKREKVILFIFITAT